MEKGRSIAKLENNNMTITGNSWEVQQEPETPDPQPVVPEQAPTQPDPYPISDPVAEPNPDPFPSPSPQPEPFPTPPEPIPQYPPDVTFK